MSNLVDPEALLIAALRDLVPAGTLVDLSTDTDVGRSQRAVLLSTVDGDPIRNAAPELAQVYIVAVVVLSRDRGTARQFADDVFWHLIGLEGQHVPGRGFVSTVDAVTLPIRSPRPTATPNVATFTQFNFQITLRVKPEQP
ncbi:hypothetical protein [Glutamicibacter nicotianae]|uniref:hypothetical protein n=1 Tax=Glutamicibacter nicotianae TaxID=37929 RepID=UPI0025533D0B|nr:hypothetical protein [Glutamicibacter nicotianae]WIV44532.1 hypothetical protein QQS42_02630 [Glutamicibacter nicotianae]